METPRTQSLPFLPGRLVPLNHLLLLCVLSLAATAWATGLIAGRESGDLENFMIVVAVYALASAVFVGSRMRFEHFRFFDIPTFFTIFAFVEFGLAPLACFLTGVPLDPSFHGDFLPFTHALIYVALGMMAFWAGSHVAARGEPARAQAAARPPRVSALSPPIEAATVWALILYCAAFGVKAYLFETFGLGYGASEQAYFNHLAAMQVAGVVFDLGTYALVILAIERSFHPFSLERKVLFWIVLVPECVWGLLSGMKSELLQNFVLVAVASSMAERRLKKSWVLAAFLGLVIVYPFSVQYRELLRSRPAEGMGVSGAAEISSLALDEATAGDSTFHGWMATGADSAMSRLNLLQSVALVLDLGSRGQWLQGDERWWMLPFYPFVPRFLWKGKPILNKGSRFSVALGRGDQTSTALTYPGDLYFEFGIIGLLVGMFVFGLAAQYLTDRFAVPHDKRRLFIYTGLFVTVLYAIELDAFDFWSTLTRNLVILCAVGWVAYRRPWRARGRRPLGAF